MAKDIFRAWLDDNKNHYALKDKSYKKVFQNKNCREYKGEVNTQLATYGDAVLKLALCKILFNNTKDNLTERKKTYESDEVLVSVIGKHYDIIEYIKFDKEDEELPKDYDYGKDKKRKYIATAIEACLGSIEKEEGFDKAYKIVKIWKKLIDEKNNNKQN